MSITFWISLFFAAPPPASACSTSGTPLLEMREGTDPSAPSALTRVPTTTRIFESGAWTVESGGQVDSGCFDRKELRPMRRALQHATWKVTSSPIACFAYDPHFTEYLLHGKLRWTERMCSGKTVDFETMQAIDLVKKDLAEDRPAPAPTPPPVPAPTPLPPPAPSCASTGTPLFEIRHRSDTAAATSTISIYSSGAWTFQPIDKDGHAGAAVTGCFDKDEIRAVRDVVNQSPWDTTFLRLVCRAYSPSFTEYYVHGQLEYTERMCGAQRLDDKSLGAIKIINDDLAKVLPATTL